MVAWSAEDQGTPNNCRKEQDGSKEGRMTCLKVKKGLDYLLGQFGPFFGSLFNTFAPFQDYWVMMPKCGIDRKSFIGYHRLYSILQYLQSHQAL